MINKHGVRKNFIFTVALHGTMHIFSGDLVQMVLVPRFPIQTFVVVTVLRTQYQRLLIVFTIYSKIKLIK